MVKRHWRKVATFFVLLCASVLVATELGSGLPGQPAYPDLGFSGCCWDGVTPPADGYAFGILDAAQGDADLMCSYSTDPLFPDGETALSNGGREVHTFWYLTSYKFASEDCLLNLEFCGGAYCWGYLNANHLHDYVNGSADYCGQALAAFGDVEFSGESHWEKWDSDTPTNNRAVIQGFTGYLKDHILPCGKVLIGVYSNSAAWNSITGGAQGPEVNADWYWLNDFSDPDGLYLLTEVKLVEVALEMDVFSWQYADNGPGDTTGCEALLPDVLEAAQEAAVSRVDLWTGSDPSRTCKP